MNKKTTKLYMAHHKEYRRGWDNTAMVAVACYLASELKSINAHQLNKNDDALNIKNVIENAPMDIQQQAMAFNETDWVELGLLCEHILLSSDLDVNIAQLFVNYAKEVDYDDVADNAILNAVDFTDSGDIHSDISNYLAFDNALRYSDNTVLDSWGAVTVADEKSADQGSSTAKYMLIGGGVVGISAIAAVALSGGDSSDDQVVEATKNIKSVAKVETKQDVKTFEDPVHLKAEQPVSEEEAEPAAESEAEEPAAETQSLVEIPEETGAEQEAAAEQAAAAARARAEAAAEEVATPIELEAAAPAPAEAAPAEAAPAEAEEQATEEFVDGSLVEDSEVELTEEEILYKDNLEKMREIFTDKTVVRIETNIQHLEDYKLSIDIELFSVEAPITTSHFLDLVEKDVYEDTFFHRSVPVFVWQTGGYKFKYNQAFAIEDVDTITNEFNISNKLGTVSMAKVGSDPHSATSQFFFNLADNNENLDFQNEGFAVFAEVVSYDMYIIDIMNSFDVYNLGSDVFGSVPLQDIIESNVALEDALVIIEDITVIDYEEQLKKIYQLESEPHVFIDELYAEYQDEVKLEMEVD